MTRQEGQHPSAWDQTDRQVRHDPSSGDAGLGQTYYIPAHAAEGHT